MKYSILAAAIFLAFIIAGTNGEDPSIMVKISYTVSWREICLIDSYLKQSLAKQIVVPDKNDGATLDVNKIVLYNFPENCQPKGSDKEAVVYIFVSKISGSSKAADVDVKMTKKLYSVLNYIIEHEQDRYLGSLFVGKVKSIEVTGKDAPEKSTDYTEIERLYIGIGVALIIIIVIIVILAVISCCKNRNKPKKDQGYRTSYHSGEEPQVRTYPAPRTSASDNPAYNAEDGKVSSRL